MDKGFKNGKIPVDFCDYASPIAVEIARKQEEDLEKAIYTVLEAYNITVDKDELLKALSYDRGQYEAGYKAGYEAAQSIDAQPVKNGRWSECWRDPARNVISVICSACEGASLTYLPKKDLAVDDVPKKICIQMPYCPKCGAKMCGGDTDGDQV